MNMEKKVNQLSNFNIIQVVDDVENGIISMNEAVKMFHANNIGMVVSFFHDGKEREKEIIFTEIDSFQTVKETVVPVSSIALRNAISHKFDITADIDRYSPLSDKENKITTTYARRAW